MSFQLSYIATKYSEQLRDQMLLQACRRAACRDCSEGWPTYGPAACIISSGDSCDGRKNAGLWLTGTRVFSEDLLNIGHVAAGEGEWSVGLS